MWRSLCRRVLCFGVIVLAGASVSHAQEFSFPEAAVAQPDALAKAMPDLARQVLPAYKEADREKYLDNLFRLQFVAGHYSDSLATMTSLRDLFHSQQQSRAAWINVQYEIYARAKMRESERLPLAEAYAQAFRETFSKLDDRTSALVLRGITTIGVADTQPDLQSDLDRQKGKTTISLADAVNLVHDYQVDVAFQVFAQLNSPLISEDDVRRYISQNDIPVKTPDGATICGMVTRPRPATGKLTTLLKFTIYVDPSDDPNDARLAAANGYAGFVGYTRGKACSPDKAIPYVHDGADAAALIDWITAQPWSDGRVGMYSGSYNGFTQWATAKHMPKGLKAMMMGAPAAPGVDVPMEGNVFWNFVYPWPFYATNKKGADDAVYGDRQRWQKLDHDFYVSGRAYRDLDKIDGTPNPIFDEWISHPSYDAYWQGMIPYEKEFARINIPVLQTVGYYFGGPGAAVYYFSEHYKYNPKAEHYLVIGPYHHIGAQFGVFGLLGNIFGSLAGLELDPVAKLDLTDLRYEWFDYVFKGTPKPSLLQDKVNYQVTGANVWKHAPSLDAMASRTLKFHLSSTASGSAYRLTERKPADGTSVALKVNFADRSDIDRKAPGGGLVADAIDTWNGIEFVSDPLQKPMEVSGLFSGRLEFVANKRDFDFNINLYEQTPAGKFVFLTSYWARASYVADRSHRRLLTPGKREQLDFRAVRLMSRQLQAGSRLVVVLSVIKEVGRQLNYGTGKDVSDETIADARESLEIQWFGDSYIVFPSSK